MGHQKFIIFKCTNRKSYKFHLRFSIYNKRNNLLGGFNMWSKPNIEWERFVFELKNAEVEIIREKVINNSGDYEDFAF